MATVTLRAPLKDLAGGQTDVAIPGDTVGEVIRPWKSDSRDRGSGVLDTLMRGAP